MLKNNIHYGGYNITITKNNVSGLYELATMVDYGGEEYREHMVSDTNPADDTIILDKFVKQIEHNK